MTGQLADLGFPLTMRAADMCRLLSVHRDTLYDRIRAGDVPAFRRSGQGPKARYEWRRPDVERWWLHRIR